MSFSPMEIAAEIKNHIPEFAISYKPDYRQPIADCWPQSIDDKVARNDWGLERIIYFGSDDERYAGEP